MDELVVEQSALGQSSKEQGNVRLPADVEAENPLPLLRGVSEELEVQQFALSDTSMTEH